MAMADSVPGVSGGSIAFLMGFYEKFIDSLNSLTCRDKKKFKEGIIFLLKLGVGWVIGMGLAVSVLASVFEVQIYKVSSLFLGFIVVATIQMFMAKELREESRKPADLICILLGIVVVVGVTLLNGHISGTSDLSHLTFGTAVYCFVVAMIAISAMVLPGISGSTILLVFGLYIPIITSVKAIMHFDFSALPAIVIFALGALTGIVLFVRLIKKALEKFPVQTRFAIIGMMIGSFYAIVKGPTTLKVPKPAMTFGTFSPVFFIIGALLVIALEFYRRSVEKKQNAAA